MEDFLLSRFLLNGACGALLITVPVLADTGQAYAQSGAKLPRDGVVRATEPTLSARQTEIMRIVRAGDGFVTEELHREFWDAMPFRDNQMVEATRILSDLIGKALGPAQNLGYETWLSAKMSLRAGRVVRSPGLDPAIKATLNASNIPSYRAASVKSVQSVDKILFAAANGTPLATANGPIFINETLIAATLSGIEGGVRRSKILFNPKWGAPLENYRYDDVHISTLSPWAFAHETSEVTLPGGRRGTLRSLSRTISESQKVFISFADFSKAPTGQKVYWPDPVGTAIRNVQASLDAVGAQGKPPYGETWRGLASASGSGTVADATGKLYATIRNVYLPEHKGFLTFMAVSQISLFDSQQIIDQLEIQTQILRPDN